jgi:hypothetical protein
MAFFATLRLTLKQNELKCVSLQHYFLLSLGLAMTSISDPAADSI